MHLPRRGQALVDQDGVVGHRLDHLQRQPVRIDRRAIAGFRYLLDQRLAPRRPVLRRQRRQSLLGARLERAAAGGLQRRHQRAQRFLHVGLQRDLGAVILGEIPIDQADLHDRQAVRQRIDLAVDRHPQRIGAEHDHQIVGRQHLAHLLLQPRQRAHEARAFGQEMRAIGRRRLIGRTAERLRQRGRLLQARRS